MDFQYNKIFTFINFENIIPPYINLCIKTWELNLQKDYQIIVLTPENINRYIDKNFLTESVVNPINPYSSAYCDYISFLAIYCNGGIFLDADTIITDGFNPDFDMLNDYETVFFGRNNKIIPGFIMSKKNSKILEELILRYRIAHHLPFIKRKRDILINNSIKNSLLKDFLTIDNSHSAYKLELLLEDNNKNNKYKDYYFTSKYSIENFLKNNKGIAALQNSATPAKYKKMSESEFLEQDILLSKIFKVLL